jgi:hypothetical protein
MNLFHTFAVHCISLLKQISTEENYVNQINFLKQIHITLFYSVQPILFY